LGLPESVLGATEPDFSCSLTDRLILGLACRGTYVWRIEQFLVVEVPKNMIGKFYDGDAYIVLHVRISINEY
jgi:hypothetical protein